MKAGTKRAKEAERAQKDADAAAAETLFVANMQYLLRYLQANTKANVG